MTQDEVSTLQQEAKTHYKDFNMQLKWMQAVIYLRERDKK